MVIEMSDVKFFEYYSSDCESWGFLPRVFSTVYSCITKILDDHSNGKYVFFPNDVDALKYFKNYFGGVLSNTRKFDFSLCDKIDGVGSLTSSIVCGVKRGFIQYLSMKHGDALIHMVGCSIFVVEYSASVNIRKFDIALSQVLSLYQFYKALVDNKKLGDWLKMCTDIIPPNRDFNPLAYLENWNRYGGLALIVLKRIVEDVKKKFYHNFLVEKRPAKSGSKVVFRRNPYIVVVDEKTIVGQRVLDEFAGGV